MPHLFLRKKLTDRIANGHPWVFQNEIGELDTPVEPGSILSVYSSSGSFIGQGYYNPQSKIVLRFLSWDEQPINQAFVTRRLREAWERRAPFWDQASPARLVSGEADRLPGLVVDKLGHYLVFQCITLGMERLKDWVIKGLQELFPNKYIFEKNDGSFRKSEQLPFIQCFHGPVCPPLEFVFEIQSIKLKINLKQAARTGYYWESFKIADFLTCYFKDRKVLDAFSYQGFLPLFATHHGAQSGLGLDWLDTNIEQAKVNKSLNPNKETCFFKQANSFDYLTQLAEGKATFDLIILDPPSMGGIGRGEEKVLSGYERLLNPSIRLLNDEGLLLLTMSGRFISEEKLFRRFNLLCRKQNKSWQIVDTFSQGYDHPILWNFPASHYFKGWLFRIFNK